MKKFILLLLSILFITAFGFAQTPPQPRPNLNGLRIMIDPGHGGYNSSDRQTNIPGISVAGQNNTYFWESVGNWDKANYLMPMLQTLGATVNLTRAHNNYGQTSDGSQTYPTLVERRTAANTWNADWFHSIHSNGGQGTETYTLMLVRQNWSGTNRANCVAGAATWPDAMTMSGHMGNNLLAYIRVTSIFSAPAALDFNFYGGCGNPNTGTAIPGYNLGVLNGTNMPAELSEGSFHSTQHETRRLMNAEYKKLEAYALRDAMMRYWQVTTPVTTGIIEGIVTDPIKPANAQGVNYVKMTLNPINRVYNGDRYSNGFYMFDNVPPGSYTLVFEADGYGTLSQPVTVVAGAVRRYDITAIDIVPPVVVNSTLESVVSLGNTSFDLTFSKIMNPASVQTNLSFSPAATSVNFVWSNNNTTVRVTPVLSSGTNYTMTIGTNAADAGGTRMTQPYTRNFRTMTTAEDRPTILTN
jgi:N-acetylmuramoyl-L-alanine amidase